MNTNNMKFAGSEKGQGALIFLAIIAVLAIIIMAMAVPLLDTFQATYLH